MTLFTMVLEGIATRTSTIHKGLTSDMILSGFSSSTLAFLVTVASLLGLLSLFMGSTKAYAGEVYGAIKFSIGFFSGVVLFLATYSLIFSRPNLIALTPIIVFSIMLITILIFFRWALNDFKESENIFIVRLIAAFALATFALITMPLVHYELEIKKRGEIARSGTPETGSSFNR